MNREKVLGFLWPESDTERARNLLKVSVYVLRKALGEDALLSAGDELRLNPTVIATDVAAFEAAIERGDPLAAAASYRGPLLDGFNLPNASEFEQWAAAARDRFAGGYAKALESLGEAAERQGDLRDAAEWWKRRAAHDPYDSRVALSLMRVLDAGGNRAAALQHASLHERLLREELGLPLPGAVAGFADQLRAGAPTVSSPHPPPSPTRPIGSAAPLSAAGVDRPSAAHGARASLSRSSEIAIYVRRIGILRMALALAVAVAAIVIAGVLWTGRTVATPEQSLAVLPFVNLSAQEELEYFSDGITEEIITHLSSFDSLKVISRTSAMRYKKSTKTLRQIATELGVAHVLEGSVRREGAKVRITAKLIDAVTDASLWSKQYDRELVDVFAVQQEIAREVGQALQLSLEGQSGVLARRGTRDPEAYELYLRGRFHWHKRTGEGHRQAIAYLHRAVERDSGYADAYSGLADAYFTAYQRYFFGFGAEEAETYARIKWAAERAVALDDGSAAAHTSLAILRWWQRDWPGAERELRRAIDLNPGYALARSWYSVLLAGLGRFDDALRESHRAYELDPFALSAANNYAARLWLARDYDAAIAQYRKTLEIDETWGSAHRGMGMAYVAKGMYRDAVRALRRSVDVDPENPEYRAELAYVLALAGNREEARRILGEVTAQEARPPGIGTAFTIARAHLALGERDSAFVWLERSDWRWPHRANLYDPTLDPLRADARFARLAGHVRREMGLRGATE